MSSTESSITTATLRMPKTFTEVDISWLTVALRSTKTINENTRVTEFDSELLGDGAGFLGDLARIRLTYEDGEGPPSVILKIPTRKQENRGFGLLVGAYESEVLFYNELAPLVDVRIPEHYFAAIEPNTRIATLMERVLSALPEQVTLWLLPRLTTAVGRLDRRSVIVMEDLGDVRIGDQVAGASIADAELAIDILARFHAAFWNSQDLDRRWLKRQDEMVLVAHGLYLQALPTLEARFHDRLDAKTRTVIDAITERGPALLRRITKGPLTLVHGDYRMDNLTFFGDEPPAAGIIDFQGVRVGHPVTDVAYFLRPNLTPDTADKEELLLLHRYQRELKHHGVMDYSFETLAGDYELAQLWVLHLGVILIGTLDMSHERGTQIVDRTIERMLHIAHRLKPDRWF